MSLLMSVLTLCPLFLGSRHFLSTWPAQVGVQEKATFVQAFGKPASLYAPILVLPGVIQVLLLLTAMAVMFHHVAPAAAAAGQHPPLSPQWRQQQLESDGADAALVTAQLSEEQAVAAEYNERHSA